MSVKCWDPRWRHYRYFNTLICLFKLTVVYTIYTRKVKVLSLPETITEKSTFRAKALRRELIVVVSGSERTFTFRVSLNTLPTLATLVRDIYTIYQFTSDDMLVLN